LLVGVAAGCGEVREVAVQDLKHVAVVARDAQGPVIYYNPELCLKAGRLMCTYDRIQAQMLLTRGNVPRQKPGDPYDTSWIRPQDILQADCRAANELRGQGQAAAEAAVQYFRRQGDAREAPNYPTGTQRAAQISECLVRY
jgi:hypothetical protein